MFYRCYFDFFFFIKIIFTIFIQQCNLIQDTWQGDIRKVSTDATSKCFTHTLLCFYRCQNYDPYLETSPAKRQYRAEYSEPSGATDLAPFRREVTMRNCSRSKCFVQLVTNETKVRTATFIALPSYTARVLAIKHEHSWLGDSKNTCSILIKRDARLGSRKYRLTLLPRVALKLRYKVYSINQHSHANHRYRI